MNGHLYIDGDWIGHELKKADITNPADGSIVGQVPMAGSKETNLAIDAAHNSFHTWSKLTANDRSIYLKKLYELIIRDKEEIGKLITLEMGKPLNEAIGEVVYAASFIEWFSEQGKRIYGETIPSSHQEKRIQVLKQPVGVVVAITPWNFPIAMLTRKIGPALAAGCTVIAKPSLQTPLTAIKLFELCQEANFPRGVINLLTGNSSIIVNEIMKNQNVRKITFTGSTEIGKVLMKQGADQVKRLSLELGGHAPMIILNDADIDKAVSGVIASKFRNAGQTCICGNRIYVQSSIYEEFIDKLSIKIKNLKVGNGLDQDVDVGPLINKEGFDKVHHHVQDAINQGAKVVVGGEGKEINQSYFYQPTLIKNVNENMLVMNEETFGPVAPIQKIETESEAVRLANDSPYGLAAYVFTESLSKGTFVVENLEYGIVGWNDGAPSVAQAPFGGMKESGIGREGSHEGIESYLEEKYVSIGI